MENKEQAVPFGTNIAPQPLGKSQDENFLRRHSFVLCYFIAILCCCGIYCIAIHIQHSNFVEGQDRIIQTYHEHSKNTQSIQTSVNVAFRQQMQEYENVRQEIKSLLELEFNHIQNEFESLEIWAGVLTVIFLIFSL